MFPEIDISPHQQTLAISVSQGKNRDFIIRDLSDWKKKILKEERKVKGVVVGKYWKQRSERRGENTWKKTAMKINSI